MGGTNGRTHALSSHLQQAKLADSLRFGLGSVPFQVFAQTCFDLALMIRIVHVDEVEHDETAEVTKAQLTGNFVDGFEVDLIRHGFGITIFSALSRVYVNRDHRFRRINDDRSAAEERHFARVHHLELRLDAEVVKDGRRSMMDQNLRRALARRDDSEIFLNPSE